MELPFRYSYSYQDFASCGVRIYCKKYIFKSFRVCSTKNIFLKQDIIYRKSVFSTGQLIPSVHKRNDGCQRTFYVYQLTVQKLTRLLVLTYLFSERITSNLRHWGPDAGSMFRFIWKLLYQYFFQRFLLQTGGGRGGWAWGLDEAGKRIVKKS